MYKWKQPSRTQEVVPYVTRLLDGGDKGDFSSRSSALSLTSSNIFTSLERTYAIINNNETTQI